MPLKNLKYRVASDRECWSLIRPVFLSEYRALLGNGAEQEFEIAVSNAEACSLLFSGDSVVGFVIHREIGRSSFGNSTYLRSTSARLRDLLAVKRRLLTIEWLTVSSSFRGRLSKVQPVDLLMGLSLRLLVDRGCDAAVGIARTDLGADRVAARFGGQSIELLNRFDIPCAEMIFESEHLTVPKIPATVETLDSLWQQRDDQGAVRSDL